MREENQEIERTMQLALLWTDAQPAVFGYILSLVKDFTDAEDVLQKVALAVVDQFDTYNPEFSFQGWAFGIAKNQTRTFQRGLYKDKHVFSDEMVQLLAETYEEIEDELGDLSEKLIHCINKVEGRAHKILELRYQDEHKTGVIAKLLGLSPGNVSVILNRTHQFLKNCMLKEVVQS